MHRLLIVHPEKKFFEALACEVNSEDFLCKHATGLAAGLRLCAQEDFDLILLRESLPDGKAIDCVVHFKGGGTPPPVIIVVGQGGTSDEVKKLLNEGVWDYILETESLSFLQSTCKNLSHYRLEECSRKKQHLSTACEDFKNKGIIGCGPGIQHCLDLVVKAAPSEANVLISGESGTGKELFAWAIHGISPRANRKMVTIDCASLPDNLVESILFGHVRGAFTGADRAQEGLIREAEGGTLFLDEVGELPLEVQKKFLRVLQERQLRPVGGSTMRDIDFRLIAATNKNLSLLVGQGVFREDLLFRLKTFHIELPPLRSRPDDIPELVYFFMHKHCDKHRIKEKRISAEFLITLRRYGWPGNVRELSNTIERAIVSAGGSDILLPIHLPVSLRVQALKNVISEPETGDEPPLPQHVDSAFQEFPPLQHVRESALAMTERKYLRELIQRRQGNIQECCDIAGLSRSRLYALLKKYDISTSHG